MKWNLNRGWIIQYLSLFFLLSIFHVRRSCTGNKFNFSASWCVLIKSYKSKNILRRITLHVLVQPSNFQSHFSFLINSFGTFLESISIILFWVKEWALAFLAVYYMYTYKYTVWTHGYTHKTHSPNVIYNNIVRIIDFSSFFFLY